MEVLLITTAFWRILYGISVFKNLEELYWTILQAYGVLYCGTSYPCIGEAIHDRVKKLDQ